MVGNISLGSRPTAVDGSLDVLTSITFLIGGSILDTSIWTIESDQHAPVLVLRQFEAKQFIPTTVGLASLEFEYGQPGQAPLLNQMMLTWKDLHRMRLGQIVGGCTPKYTIWRRQKIEDAVPLSVKMQVSILNPTPIQLRK